MTPHTQKIFIFTLAWFTLPTECYTREPALLMCSPARVRAAHKPIADIATRIPGSVRLDNETPSSRLFLRIVYGCINSDFCNSRLNLRDCFGLCTVIVIALIFQNFAIAPERFHLLHQFQRRYRKFQESR